MTSDEPGAPNRPRHTMDGIAYHRVPDQEQKARHRSRHGGRVTDRLTVTARTDGSAVSADREAYNVTALARRNSENHPYRRRTDWRRMAMDACF